MDRLKGTGIGIEYSDQGVGQILGIQVVSNEVPPGAEDGEIVIYYGGWNLQTLQRCRAGQRFMQQHQDWHESIRWSAEAGYYRLLLPVPKSNNMNWERQLTHLRRIDRARQVAPTAIAATALLVHLVATGEDILDGHFCRCAEASSHISHVELTVRLDCLYVEEVEDEGRYPGVWLAAAQKC